jgi:hypothetical protein
MARLGDSITYGNHAITGDVNVGGTLTVDGDVYLGGTVDGRNVSSDGSKLDNIESNATADQTKADIDALNIDADTLDGLNSTQFVRSDTGKIPEDRLPATITNQTRFSNSTTYFGGTDGNTAEIWMQTGGAGSPQIGLTDNNGDMAWAIGGDDTGNSFKIHGNASGSIPTIDNLSNPFFEISTSGVISGNGSGLTGVNSTTLDGINSTSFVRDNGDSSMTGDYSTTGNIESGRASGGVALTINDSQGNANVTFNHADGVAEQVGNSGRITVNTDSTTAAAMIFEVLDNASTGTVNTLPIMEITEGGVEVVQGSFTGDGSGLTGTASLRATGTTKADVGLGSVDNYSRGDYDARYLAIGAKSADSNKLDGVNSTQFLRSDTTDYLTGKLRLRGDIENEYNYRDHGVYGDYDSQKTNHIWSMGSAYRVPANGLNFGNLYGLAYYHRNNGSNGSMAGSHQMVWCHNGTPKAAMGSNIWTSGNVTAYSDIRVKTNINVIPKAIAKVKQLSGYTYERTDIKDDMTGEAVKQTGVIAQEVIKVLPEAVTGGPTENNPEGHYSVAYGNMIGLLIESIKEQQTQIDELKRRIG